MDNIDFNGMVYDLHGFTGTVIDTSKRSQTVYTESDSRLTDNGHIRTRHSSQTTTFDDVIVRNSLGKEHHLRLVNWNCSCGVGNELRFFWIDHQSTLWVRHNNAKSYLAIKNYTTDEIVYNEYFIGLLFYGGYETSFWNSLFGLNLILICLCFGLALIHLGIVPIILLYVTANFFHIKYWRMAQNNLERVKHELYSRM